LWLEEKVVFLMVCNRQRQALESSCKGVFGVTEGYKLFGGVSVCCQTESLVADGYEEVQKGLVERL
jgi:hypothetical protein